MVDGATFHAEHGLLLRRPLLQGSAGSRTQASALPAHGLRSCGAQGSFLRGLWGLPGPGIELISLALQGGFSTTGRSGKP